MHAEWSSVPQIQSDIHQSGRRRSLDSLRALPRSGALSQYRAALERTGQPAPPPDWPNLGYFSGAAWREWLRVYARDAFRRNCRFRTETGPERGIYPLRDEHGAQSVRISMAGDWGTGTEEAYRVAQGMMRREHEPHFTIHLGDVYFIGDAPSIDENCLGIRNPANNYDPVTWPIGRLGSFALNGNHEMYATGEPYFRDFLPRLGIVRNGAPTGQPTSYFCLENDYWRIIALDTGYHSRGLPFLYELDTYLRFLRPTCRLPDPLVSWVKDVVRLGDDGQRGLILLSHHQYYTAFDDVAYRKAAQQLAEMISRPVLWFWGHEHRMSGYAPFGPAGIKAHGRCIGHGGMPVERRAPPAQRGDCKLLFYDDRPYTGSLGRNGYVTLAFEDSFLTVKYFSLGPTPHAPDELILREEWEVGRRGSLSVDITQVCLEDGFYGPTQWGR